MNLFRLKQIRFLNRLASKISAFPRVFIENRLGNIDNFKCHNSSRTFRNFKFDSSNWSKYPETIELSDYEENGMKECL